MLGHYDKSPVSDSAAGTAIDPRRMAIFREAATSELRNAGVSGARSTTLAGDELRSWG